MHPRQDAGEEKSAGIWRWALVRQNRAVKPGRGIDRDGLMLRQARGDVNLPAAGPGDGLLMSGSCLGECPC